MFSFIIEINNFKNNVKLIAIAETKHNTDNENGNASRSENNDNSRRNDNKGHKLIVSLHSNNLEYLITTPKNECKLLHVPFESNIASVAMMN